MNIDFLLMIDYIDKLLDLEPFSIENEKKDIYFKNAMKQGLKFHYKNSVLYKQFCDRKKFDPEKDFKIKEIPYIPSNIFKKVRLQSVTDDLIIRTINSSSTTGNKPSVVLLDKITSERQLKVIISILSNFIGKERRHFLVIDYKKNIKSKEVMSSRSSAVRGLTPFMKNIEFLLDDELNINIKKLENFLNSSDNDCVGIFGFTWIIYLLIKKYQSDEKIKKLFLKLNNAYVLHSGGWKKLQDQKISKQEYNRTLSNFFNTTSEKVIDFYGMVEQLGIIYPDCEFGNKHVPSYSHIIIRDVNTLEPVKDGKRGFIQILTPIPHSYPGVSILTDDVGKILGKDDCKCGRKGIYFNFLERHKTAELEGCGDTFEM